MLPSLGAGGAERVVVTLLRHLDRRRFAPMLAVVNTRSASLRGDIPADVEVVDLQSCRVRDSLPKIMRLVWARKPDLVFSTLGHLNLALAMLLPLLPRRTRYVARETSIVSRVIAGYPLRRLWAWSYRRFYRRFDLVICQSRAMRDELVADFGLPSTKSVVINNPIDVARIRALAAVPPAVDEPLRSVHPNQLSLVAIGRLSPEKGLDILIRALHLCKRAGVHLTIVGDGPLRQQLESFAHEQGVHDQVAFSGHSPNPYALLRRADALVLSSHYEGFPNVVLEALACGIPVIARPAVGGLHEILEGIEGCRIAADMSAEALAFEIDHFCRGTPIAERAVEAYDVPNILQQYEAALE